MAPRPQPAQRQQKPSDPIFSRPYEPGAAPEPPAASEPQPAARRRRERPVAALLGGLKRAPTTA
jgi:hypothetical protein